MVDKIIYFKNKYITRSPFSLHVFTLMSGTMIAQAIPLAIAPILTRLYSPSNFGVFALYTAIVSMLSVIVTGRYELAIILPESEEDAFNIFILTSIIILISTLLFTFIIVFFKSQIVHMLRIPDIGSWLYFVPLSIFIIGFYQAVNNWLIYKRKFKMLATTRICQSGLVGGVQVGFGSLGFTINGLIPGQIIGQGLTIGLVGMRVWKNFKPRFSGVTKEKILQQAKRYKKFPKYSLVADFVNIAANQIPYFMFNRYFGMVILGFYSLAQRVLGTPISLIAFSLLEVFKERASRDYRDTGNCRDIYTKTFKHLFLLSIVPALILFIAAPQIFTFIFGRNWTIAGEYTQILSVMFFLKFISSPLSCIIYIAEKQNYDLYGQLLLLVFALVSISCGAYFKNPKIGVILFSLSYSLMYIFSLIISYYFTIKRDGRKF